MDPVWTGSMMHRSSTSLDCLDKEKGRGKKKKKKNQRFLRKIVYGLELIDSRIISQSILKNVN